MKTTHRNHHRWFVVGVFFTFLLLHQTDKFLIGPLTTPIMETFHINEEQMGAVSTAALLVGAVLYPLWGYLYDRFARVKLLALASLIWGLTTTLNASAPTFPLFMATRATTGIDDSSYPGLYSIIADYFPPLWRGKIYGILNAAGAFGFALGMVLALVLGGVIGWRNVFYITGGLGVLVAVVIFFGVREPQRGQSEPELAALQNLHKYTFDLAKAKQLFRKPTLLFLFAEGFFGVFPWTVLSFWLFRYLEVERGYSSDEIMFTLLAVVPFQALGDFLGGVFSDAAFKHNRRGRLLVATSAVLAGVILLNLTVRVPVDQKILFAVMMALTGMVIPMPGAATLSSIHDVTLPEVRSTAQAVQSFVENIGSAAGPLLAGAIAVRSNLETAIVSISTGGWVLCAVLFAFATWFIPRDIVTLRTQMQERARMEEGR